MSVPSGESAAREIARALTTVLGRALEPKPGEADVTAARDVAQLLALPGLDRVLGAFQLHANRPWPQEFEPVLERVRRLANECEAVGDPHVFHQADRELGALAAQLEALEWSEPLAGAESRRAAIPTLALGDVLEDLPIANDESLQALRRVRLTAPVGAALRAAVDWLMEGAAPRPLRLSAEDSVLQVVCEHVSYAGLRAADKVLSHVGGNLSPASATGPEGHAPGSWVLRLPTFTPRSSCLMLLQGGLRLAVPWHSVLRIFMVPATEIEPGYGGLGLPVLDPIEPLSGSTADRPVVLVAHGLKRAYMVSDRLVWRLEAQPCETQTQPPKPGLVRAVQADDGQVYWLVEPGWLLERVDAPALADPRSGAPLADSSPVVLGPEDVQALPVPEAPAPSDSVTRMPAPDAPPEAGTTHETSWIPTAPAPAPPRGAPRPDRSEERPHAPPDDEVSTPALPALLAEDSITARVFLTRLLEQHGFSVRAVTSAETLFAELARGPWTLVCVDVELPDGRGVPFLRSLVSRAAREAAGVPLVALVRDSADITAAKASGIARWLRKPFDRESLYRLLSSLELFDERER